MDITAKVILDATRAEAEAQLNDAVGSMCDEHTTHSDSVRRISESLSSLADRIERATQPASDAESPGIEFSSTPAQGRTVRVTREMLDNVELGPDPEPYVGFSGHRYALECATFASLEDGPVGFDPRDSYGPTVDER